MKLTTSSIVAFLLAVPGLQACGVTESTQQRCFSVENGETPQNIDRAELDYMIDDLRKRGGETWRQTNCAEWSIMRLSRTQALARKLVDRDVAIWKRQLAGSLEWIRDNCGTQGGAMTAGNSILVKLTRV